VTRFLHGTSDNSGRHRQRNPLASQSNTGKTRTLRPWKARFGLMEWGGGFSLTPNLNRGCPSQSSRPGDYDGNIVPYAPKFRANAALQLPASKLSSSLHGPLTPASKYGRPG